MADREAIEVERVEFKVAFTGPAVTDGRMDVAELAPALLGLGEIFQGANKTLNGDRTSVRVEVTAFTPGSFIVTFDLAQTIWEHAKQILLAPDVTAAFTLWTMVTGGKGVLDVIRFLHGKPRPEVVVQVDSDFVEIVSGGTTIRIRKQVLQMVELPEVRQAAERLTAPLRREGIEALEFRQQEQVVQKIVKDEAPTFIAPPAAELGPPAEPFHANDYEAVVEVVKPWFDEDRSHKWGFKDARGPLNATVLDEDFRTRVQEGMESFRKGDLMKVIVRATTSQSGMRITTEYEIVRILGRIPRPTQGRFSGT